MSLNRAGSPAEEPVTLAEALAHLRETPGDAEVDAYVTALISVARENCEAQSERTLIDTPWRLTLDAFPTSIRLDMPPVLSVESVSFWDEEGVEQTLDPADYQVDTAGRPGWIAPAPNKSWPSVQPGRINAVTVAYRAGVASAADVPLPLKQWVLLAIGDLYANRNASAERALQGNAFADALLAPYRMLGL